MTVKEVHIIMVDGRIIDVYERHHEAHAVCQMLTDAAKIVDQINDHQIFIESKEVK